MDKVRKVHYSNNVQKIRTSQLCYFLSDRMNDNIKISLFCHNRYEIFVCCGHKLKVCAECSRFSIYALDISSWNITLGSQEQKLCYIV